jgi:uncharacterized protein (TIGR03435 family)
MRSMAITVVLFVVGTIGFSAQAPAAFDVASIKPNRSMTVRPRLSVGFLPGGRFEAIAATLQGLIAIAHGGGQMLRPSQVVGAPGWIGTERFDIQAQAERGTAGVPPDQMLVMLQNLLADRFKLAVHWEKREQPIYALTFRRPDRAPGPRLRRAEADCDTRAAQISANATVRPMVCGLEGAPGRVLGRTMSLADFATRQLPSILDRLVVDRTGVDGSFDWDLDWAPGPGEPSSISVDGAPAPSTGGPSIFTALEEQLGLKLETERGQVDVLVVDAVSRPTPD